VRRVPGNLRAAPPGQARRAQNAAFASLQQPGSACPHILAGCAKAQPTALKISRRAARETRALLERTKCWPPAAENQQNFLISVCLGRRCPRNASFATPIQPAAGSRSKRAL